MHVKCNMHMGPRPQIAIKIIIIIYHFHGKVLAAVILTYILFHCFYMSFYFISVFYCYVLSVTDMEF